MPAISACGSLAICKSDLFGLRASQQRRDFLGKCEASFDGGVFD